MAEDRVANDRVAKDRVANDWEDYATRWAALHGGYDPRRASPLVRGWLWMAYRSARLLASARIAPSTVTTAGVVLAAAVVPVASVGGGWPLLAAALVVLGALADTVDGALALVAGRETRLGRLYDSVADRLTEAAWLTGFWVLGAPGWLVTCCGAISWLHEYVRARAAIAGFQGIGVVTAGERPTRVLVAGFGLGLGGVTGLVAPQLAAGTVTAAATATAAATPTAAATATAVGTATATVTAAGTVTAAAAVWALLGSLGLAHLSAAVLRDLGLRDRL